MGWEPLDYTEQEVSTFERENRKKARFLVDESLGIGVAGLLGKAGWKVKYTHDLGLAGRSDEDVFAAAWKEDLILLTHDDDFLDDRRFPPHRNPGIVVIRPGAQGSDKGLLATLGKALELVGSTFIGRKLKPPYSGFRFEVTILDGRVLAETPCSETCGGLDLP